MTMAAASPVATDWTTCSICLELFDNPKSLPCIHGFCLECLKRYFRDDLPGDEVPCPLCRKQFKIPANGLEGLQHHFFIQQLVDRKKGSRRGADEEACEVCLEEENAENIPAATIYCIDCRQKLCERCSRPHRRMCGRAHELKPFNKEMAQLLRGSYCKKHTNTQVKLYCYECSENICPSCSTGEHRNHYRREIQQVAGNCRPGIEAEDKRILSKISTVKLQLEKMTQDALAFTGKAEDAENLVTEAGDAVKRLVDARVGDFVQRLRSAKSDNTKQFREVEEQLQLALVAMESFHTYARELLDKGRPSDVTGAANEVYKRAKELLDNDVTSLKYCPPNITFTPADVKQLILIGSLTISANSAAPAASVVLSVRVKEQQVSQQQDNVKTRTHQSVHSGTASVVQQQSNGCKQQMNGCRGSEVLRCLHSGNPVYGVTLLDDMLYVLRDKASQQIPVYDTHSYRIQRRINIPKLLDFTDMTSCSHYYCLYIGGGSDDSVLRVELPEAEVTEWPVNDELHGLSVTHAHTVLVTCCAGRRIKEFTTHGEYLRKVQLPPSMSPWHAILMPRSEHLILSHGCPSQPIHRVCKIQRSDSKVLKSYGGVRGSDVQQMYTPAHLAIDKDGYVFVADHNNYRVLLLSPALSYIREVVSWEHLKWKPETLCIDTERDLLYVAVNEWDSGAEKCTAGRVVVIGI